MSILGQAELGELVGFIVLSLLTLAGVVAAWRLGLFRRGAVCGPDRVGEQGGWPLLVVLFLGTSAWLGTQIGLATYKQVMWTREGNEGQFQMKDLTAGDYAFLSTVPGVVAVLVIAVSLRMFAKDQRPRLGVNHNAFPAGVTRGIAGVFLVMPLVLWVSTLTEWVYRAVEFKHPTEHELLRAMKESGPVTRWMLIGGAVLVAPVIEELLFRGLFQTLLVWAFNRAARRRGAGEELASHAGRLSGAAGRWMAIGITSVVFAGIHDKWSVPPIFVLALCLGFAYERTGSLWVTMSIHALFNGFQTLFYLMVVAK
jgi:membrane protease YdiL (CAAX protease family)